MKNTTTVVMAALVGMAIGTAGFAQERPVSPSTPSPQTGKGAEPAKAQATVITGTVTLVDAKTGKLTIKTKDKEIKLTTESQSTKSALAKLKVGDTARVFERGGAVIAVSPVSPQANSKTSK